MTSVVKNTTFPFYFEAFPDLKYYLAVVGVVETDSTFLCLILWFRDP